MNDGMGGTMVPDHAGRLGQLRARLGPGEAFVSLDGPTNLYLAGLSATASAVVVTETSADLLVDFRYIEQARQSAATGWTITETGEPLTRAACRVARERGATGALVEPDRLTLKQWHGLLEEASGIRCEPREDLTGRMRQVKDAGEIAAIRRAIAIAEASVMTAMAEVRAGITEAELAARIEYEFKRRGARKPSFDTIVLFGARSSLPHGMPGDTRLEPDSVILVDCGCLASHYCSDLTRTWFFGTLLPPWFREIYEVTHRAQAAAIAAIRGGACCQEVDAAARDVIRGAGYGQHFGHGTGHSLGLEIHENPRLNLQDTSILKPGMVVTVEPGIYLPGRGGVRIEDVVLVTETGAEVLTSLPGDLQVIKP
ncbi:MAG TPA: M24 family metallopeptidase [Candidatus Hydrogenedentes bacterium]|nr:M24 family metallopeptidase [Candidatus Hydrogenedentota bacterium]